MPLSSPRSGGGTRRFIRRGEPTGLVPPRVGSKGRIRAAPGASREQARLILFSSFGGKPDSRKQKPGGGRNQKQILVPGFADQAQEMEERPGQAGHQAQEG